MRRRALLASALLPWRARAQSWPQRAIRLVVAYPPGGVSDEIARALAEKLGQGLGVPVLVEHRPGAGGAVAMDWLVHAAPDGYTLCFSAISPLTLAPRAMHAEYDPLRNIVPVASIMFTPILVVGTAALQARDFEAMLAVAHAQPGSVRWATSGIGTVGHAVLEQVKRARGIDLVHIPYKGGGQQLTDALGGQFEVLSTNVAPQQLAHVRAGRFKALAVGAPARLPVLPDVPTFAELGIPQANIVSLFGVFAPAGTPPPVLERLNGELNRAIAEPDIRARLLASSNTPAGGSMQRFADAILREARAAAIGR
jgi:tripartite-type tricarboxylate transporter receptor subunit TctC